MGIFVVVLVIDGSSVVEYVPHHRKVEGSNLAATGIVRKNMQKSFIALVIGVSKVVDHFPLHHKVECFSPSITGRDKVAKSFIG